MAWRFHGRARVDPQNPRAFGVCDRCGMYWNLEKLNFQFDWRGNRLQNLEIRVCQRCMDVPQEQYRPIIVPPDPMPVYMPRPDTYASQQMPYLLTDTTFNRQILDTYGQPIWATSQLQVAYLSNATSPVSGITNAAAADGYQITAPDGGPVVLIPE